MRDDSVSVLEVTMAEQALLLLKAGQHVYQARSMRRLDEVFRGQSLHLRVQVARVVDNRPVLEVVDLLGRTENLPGGADQLSAEPGARFDVVVERLGTGQVIPGVRTAAEVAGTFVSRAEVARAAFPDLREVSEPSGVLGSIRDMSVGEVLQSLELGRKTARVEYRPKGRRSGQVYLVDGRVVWADWEHHAGAEAVYALMLQTRGAFMVRFGVTAPGQNVDESTSFLLLEGMRRVEEFLARQPMREVSGSSGR